MSQPSSVRSVLRNGVALLVVGAIGLLLGLRWQERKVAELDHALILRDAKVSILEQLLLCGNRLTDSRLAVRDIKLGAMEQVNEAKCMVYEVKLQQLRQMIQLLLAELGKSPNQQNQQKEQDHEEESWCQTSNERGV